MRPLLITFILLTALTGVVYPLSVRFIATLLFSRQAEGSLIVRNGVLVGSELIGQSFSGDRYFWGRPSATTPYAYNAAASSGSNLGPTNPALVAAINERVQRLISTPGHDSRAKIPVDLVTTSASGLDPHIGIASAEYQVNRIAKNRSLSVDAVKALIDKHSESRLFGVFGESRVNVLKLNLALDELGK